MYRLREMTVDDKVCEQVDRSLLEVVYPKELIERCVQQSEPWNTRDRRVRLSTALSLVWFVIAMALWSRRNQCQVWKSLVGALSDLHPAEPDSSISASGLSGRRSVPGSQCVQPVFQERCQLLATPEQMPSAFYGRYRLIAIDGTLFHVADTKANAAAFGRSSNQYGPGAYPQVKCVLLAECGGHAVVGLQMDRYDVSEVHGAYRLLSQLGPDMVLLVDAGLISGAFIEQVRQQRTHLLGALEAGAWEHPKRAHRLRDGSILAWVEPSGGSVYRQQHGMWVRIISYRITDVRLGEPDKGYRLVTTLLNPRMASALSLLNLYQERWEIELVIDEIKTHERGQRKVLRSKTPAGVHQELYGIYLAHYAIRALLAASAIEAEVDPDRLSFTDGLFELTEMLTFTLTIESESYAGRLQTRLRHKLARHVLPPRRLRINRREIKQIYHTYKPTKRGLPPFAPFEPEQQFLDFVELLDPLALTIPGGGLK